jgi:hypothetical protein
MQASFLRIARISIVIIAFSAGRFKLISARQTLTGRCTPKTRAKTHYRRQDRYDSTANKNYDGRQRYYERFLTPAFTAFYTYNDSRKVLVLQQFFENFAKNLEIGENKPKMAAARP